MFAQISFKLVQKARSSGTILGGLCGIRMDPIEIVTTDKQVAGKTTTVFERIPRGLRKLERFTLAFAHFRGVDDVSSLRFLGLRARFLSDLFFGSFEWRFHINHLSFRAKSRNPAE